MARVRYCAQPPVHRLRRANNAGAMCSAECLVAQAHAEHRHRGASAQQRQADACSSASGWAVALPYRSHIPMSSGRSGVPGPGDITTATATERQLVATAQEAPRLNAACKRTAVEAALVQHTLKLVPAHVIVVYHHRRLCAAMWRHQATQ